jgi:SOS-response transcriptional repressor LexA
MSTGCITSTPFNSLMNNKGQIYTSALITQGFSNLFHNTKMNNDKYKQANAAIVRQLNDIATDQDLTPTEIARRTSVPQPTVHRILSGQSEDPKITIIRKIAECLGTTLAELEEAADRKNRISEPATRYRTATPNSAQPTAEVPLINWEELNNTNSHTSTTAIPCPTAHSTATFATTVKDNTMTTQYGRSYPQGSLIFVDPTQAKTAKNGDRVLALIEGTIPTFKIYGEADGERYLQSINPQYPIITRQFTIIGVIIGTWMPETD